MIWHCFDKTQYRTILTHRKYAVTEKHSATQQQGHNKQIILRTFLQEQLGILPVALTFACRFFGLLGTLLFIAWCAESVILAYRTVLGTQPAYAYLNSVRPLTFVGDESLFTSSSALDIMKIRVRIPNAPIIAGDKVHKGMVCANALLHLTNKEEIARSIHVS